MIFDFSDFSMEISGKAAVQDETPAFAFRKFLNEPGGAVMKVFCYFLMVFFFIGAHNSLSQKAWDYPLAPKDSVVDNYHGTQISDPYQWMENPEDSRLKKWLEDEVRLTDEYFSSIPFRESIRNYLTDVWNYEKFSVPRKEGDYIIYARNDGLQNQSVVYIQKGLDGQPEVLLDPNQFSEDGSVVLAGYDVSPDQKYVGYAISRGGSDWREFFVMDLQTRKRLPDHLQWIKFSGMAWYKDGFFYSRYDAPDTNARLKSKNEYQKLYYHRLGSLQQEDQLILEDREHPYRGFGAQVTPDEKYLIISVWEGASSGNRLYYQPLGSNSPVIRLIDTSDAHYEFVANDGESFYILTDKDAPNFHLVKVNLHNPDPGSWEEIIPEGEFKISNISFLSGRFIVEYLVDASSVVKIFDQQGKEIGEIPLPGIGTVSGFYGKPQDNETFYSFSSIIVPPTIYHYDVNNNRSTIFRKPEVKFNPNQFVVRREFYTSKDGTRIPIFLVHKKGLKMDGKRPALLYGYGGFNISMTPSFRLTILPLLEKDGVYAQACLRGGGEYGEEWHKAGMREKKQNVFDDFISAAQYLINSKITNPGRLGIYGGSNGGLLVGAVLNQRPELFKVAIAAVGVMDMLRFHKFTIGWAWVPEYGSSDNPDEFQWLIRYSPLHNIRENAPYPAILVTTADHDDRVYPAHSFKYVATLQEKYRGLNPVLLRLEQKVGHGAQTTNKVIDYYTDLWSFFFYNQGVSF